MTHARPGEAALREQRRARDGSFGGDHDEVVGVVLDADVGDVVREAARECRHRRRAQATSLVELSAAASPAEIASKIDAIASTCSDVEVVEDVAAHAVPRDGVRCC